MVNLIFVGMIFESFVIAIQTILLILILRKYFVKRHELTLLLFEISLGYTLAIIFSWFSKILVLYSTMDYLQYQDVAAPQTLESWFLLRITDFRISFLFVILAIYLSYILRVKVFESEFNQKEKIAISGYTIFTFIYSLIIYERGNVILDVFAFLFILILMSITYIPFFARSLKYYQQSDKKVIKNAFLSLAIMSINYMMVFVFFLFDRILIFLGDPGFTLFYFLAWTSGVIAIIGAYLGYIRPKVSQD